MPQRRDRKRAPERKKEGTLLISVAGRVEHVLPSGEQEIAELIETPLEDLTDLPFGARSKMWMSRSMQIDHEAPINRAASHALKLSGLEIAIRGPVVVHHEKIEAMA